MLQPQENQYRELRTLSGIWRFLPDYEHKSKEEKWHERALPSSAVSMPVPSSYNDITNDKKLRQHVGEIWYECEFCVSKAWLDRSVVLRFDGVTHHAKVWINGRPVTTHKGGFLPFRTEVNTFLQTETPNRLTVAVSNVLDSSTLPLGKLKKHEIGDAGERIIEQEYYHSDFNYAGITRNVHLMALPRPYIEDISVQTRIVDECAEIEYKVLTMGYKGAIPVTLHDADGKEVVSHEGASGVIKVKQPHLWHPDHPYLYTLRADLLDTKGERTDGYALNVGIRSISIEGAQICLNNTPIHLKGFEVHNDVPLRGSSCDEAAMIRDMQLIKWSGANSVRFANYPVDQAWLNLADREGLLVISELPASGLHCHQATGASDVFTAQIVSGEAQRHHIHALREQVNRDKNHPSVIAWSLANEPDSEDAASFKYFEPVLEELRQLDRTRLVTIPERVDLSGSHLALMVDFISLNLSHKSPKGLECLEVWEGEISSLLHNVQDKYAKPVMVTQYGASAQFASRSQVAGAQSEDFQAEVMAAYHRIFDKLGSLAGEHVCAFADFETNTRMPELHYENCGAFSRQREAKLAALKLRERWSSVS